MSEVLPRTMPMLFQPPVLPARPKLRPLRVVSSYEPAGDQPTAIRDLVGGLLALMRLTPIGLALRAMAEKPDAAGLMGIDTGKLAALVSLVCGALAGAGGVLIGLNFNAIQPYMGEAMMLRGFVVIIIGGLGDVRGALIAGLLLGVVETLTAGYIDSGLKEAVAFVMLVAVLWTRPSGLFGRAHIQRA